MDIKRELRDHAPELLTGLGIAGMVVTAIFVGKSTLKCNKILTDKDKTTRQKIKEVAPYYIPAIISGVGSAICVVGSMSVQNKRNAALAAAASFAEMTLREYRNKVVEVIGEKKEEKIQQEIVEDRMRANPPAPAILQVMDDGKMPCCDATTNFYFRASKADVDNLESELNFKLQNEMYVNLFDYYYGFGIPNTSLGNLEWKLEKGRIKFERRYGPMENGTACLYITPNILEHQD